MEYVTFLLELILAAYKIVPLERLQLKYSKDSTVIIHLIKN
jgi:hypothetical protein